MRKKKVKTERSVDARGTVRVVTLNDFITLYGKEYLTVKAKKLLYIALAQARQTDKEFFTYRISPLEFAEIMDISVTHVYEEADRIPDQLMSLFLRYEKEDGRSVEKYQVFATCNLDDTDIIFQLSTDMVKFLLEIKGSFTQPLLLDFMKMKSPYTMSVWHLMQREMKSKKPNHTETIEFDLSLAELRQVTGTEDKLPQMVHFKERVLDKSIKEIRDLCGVAITYDNLKSGRVITGFHFYARNIYGFDLNDLDPFFVERVTERAKAIKR